MERFPVLPWRSPQDLPRGGGLRGINDKRAGEGFARSLGSGFSLFSPPASQGSGPSPPETGNCRISASLPALPRPPPPPTNTQGTEEETGCMTRKSQAMLFSIPLRKGWQGPGAERKLKEKERFILCEENEEEKEQGKALLFQVLHDMKFYFWIPAFIKETVLDICKSQKEMIFVGNWSNKRDKDKSNNHPPTSIYQTWKKLPVSSKLCRQSIFFTSELWHFSFVGLEFALNKEVQLPHMYT